MQIDIEPEGSWLTESAPHNSLPTGASVWIDPAIYAPPVNASPASGKGTSKGQRQQPNLASPSRQQPNPMTPIPAQEAVQRVVQRHTGHVVPQQPAQAVWEYESESYAVGTSLPSLSLMVPETPTQPQIPFPSPRRETRRLPRIDEIDTTPPPAGRPRGAGLAPALLPCPAATGGAINLAPTAPRTISLRLDEAEIAQLSPALSQLKHQPSIDEIDTLPDASLGVARKAPAPTALILPAATSRTLVPRSHPTDLVESETASWTAGRAANSAYAQLIADPTRRRRRQRHTLALNPLDRVRWWLLHPGRIEFILWLFGTLLLIAVTCSLLLLTAFSLNWFTPALPGAVTSSTSARSSIDSGTQPSPIVTTTPGLSLSLLDKGPFLPGQPVHLRGQGFSHHGNISFSCNGTWAIVNQNDQALTVQADAEGAFTVTIWTEGGSGWHIGHNMVIARDKKTNHLAAIDIVLDAAPIGKSGPTAPVSPSTPGAAPTSPGHGPLPTPVGQTPVPITPTVTTTPPPAPSPSPTSVPPAPSPTQVPPAPSPTSTVGSTPTPTDTPSNDSNGTGSSSLGNDLSSSSVNAALPSHLAGFNPLVVLMIVCYALALALLGVAGVLHRRKG
ncbi:MAG TPA: hypothetical protein VJ761_00450 [Ktedonobacteraceae bacterium]|nr:hypothetical protein [Ktedonobacteraceae bacterium]